jgi:D-3-phosphoglycerate dehydrogenase
LVLVSSRSFGVVATIGSELLEDAGFTVQRVGPEERPLDAAKLARILASQQPEVLLSGAEPIPRSVLTASPNLRMVQKHGVGVDNIDLGAATDLGIAVANAPGTNTEAVADLTVGFMLSLLRSIVPAAVSTRSGGWERFIGRELGRSVVGVIGTGRIGRDVISRLSGFGPRVLVYDVYEDANFATRAGVEYVTLERLLRESDIVTLHIPLMDETRELLSAERLSWMKPTAYLVNIARGELVDEAALAAHLAGGGLAGAAVDVFATEPPTASPLLKLDNVVATPHIGAYTAEAMENMARRCAETIIRVMAGERPENLLNRDSLALDVLE